jgi:hypothetical protein
MTRSSLRNNYVPCIFEIKLLFESNISPTVEYVCSSLLVLWSTQIHISPSSKAAATSLHPIRQINTHRSHTSGRCSCRSPRIRNQSLTLGGEDHKRKHHRDICHRLVEPLHQLNSSGTSFLFHPGLLPGGSYSHTCHVGRPIGYYLELLVPLAPFCKKPFDANLFGVTGEEGRDMTVRLSEI